jgi:hypothetical protein
MSSYNVTRSVVYGDLLACLLQGGLLKSPAAAACEDALTVSSLLLAHDLFC